MKAYHRILLASGLLLSALSHPAAAEVKLPGVISSHMVLQRDAQVPIWGTAAPAEVVTVSFRGQKQTATADKDGNWRVKLEALKAGGPDALVVSGTNTLTLDDVLVGEVWVGSGQSNMQGNSAGYIKGDEVLAKLVAAAPYPRLRLITGKGRWAEATQQQAEGFSALLFAFGLRLQQELDVPVGLMLGAVGGTPSGYWLSQEAYDADPAIKHVLEKFAATYDYEAAQKQYEKDLERWTQIAEKAKQEGKPDPGRKPQPPRKAGEASGKIGNLYEAHIRQFIPYAIRGVLWDQGESGTAVHGLDQYTLMGALIRGWRNEWGQGEFPFLYVQKPSGWGCAWDPTNPTTDKADAFRALPPQVPADGQYRETHIRIMQYPHTFMVTSSDLGPNTHPSNKSGYGDRASRVALGGVYGRNVEIYGPIYDAHKIDGTKVRVSFKHVGQGLAMKHGDKLQGFAVAGDDKVFHWADATIDGDNVVVSSDKVSHPTAVRYAWAQQHAWANLFNKDGLPALAFRTDN